MTGSERDVLLKALDLMKSSGLDVSVYGSDDKPIVVSDVNPGGSPYLVFNGHLDTVPIGDPSAWRRPPFSPYVEEGKLYGRGASDMKASCAVMMHVMEILNDTDVGCSVGAQLVPDEEAGGGRGTGVLVKKMDERLLRRPDGVVIGERSDLKIRVAERGSFRFSIRFRGRSTHTAYARLEGVNAIAKAAKGVMALEKHIDKYHQWIGHPVLSVNSVKAGTVMNQVPDECVIGIDRRLIIGETADTVVKEVTDALLKAGEGDPDWIWELEASKDSDGNYVYTPASFTPPDSRLSMLFHEAVRLVTGRKPELFVQWAGGTDGKFYRQAGIETIGMGPVGEHAHGPNEFVSVDSLVAQAKIYLAVVHSFSKT